MSNQLESYLHSPSKQQFASTFRVVSRFSFWIQLALGAVSGIVLLLAMFSRNVTTQTNNPAIGFGIFLAIGGILLLCFRIYWSFRYRRLAKRLQAPNTEIQPKKDDIIKVLQTGLFAVSYTHLTAADDLPCVDFGGRRIIKKKNTNMPTCLPAL